MAKCKCPKGYPKIAWTRFESAGPERNGWRFGAQFRVHTGKCPLTDEPVEVFWG